MSAPGQVHETGRFVACGHDFAVRTSDPALTAYIEGFLAPLARPGDPASWYELIDHCESLKRFELRHDGRTVIAAKYASRALNNLLWHINQQVIADPDHVVVHAAGAERDGVGLVLTGPMEAGKTTLVTGLVQRGFRYLTDEAVRIDPSTFVAHPYHKPLSIDPGSWELFADLRPDLPARLEPYLDRQWQVPATRLAPDVLAAPTRPRVLVRTRYVAGARTRLRQLDRSDMLQTLLGQTFHLSRQPRRAFLTLGELVRTSSCYDLICSDLDDACTAVIEIWQDAHRQEVA